MAKFRRGRSAEQPIMSSKPTMSSTASQMGYEVGYDPAKNSSSKSAWQARRRRRRNKALKEGEQAQQQQTQRSSRDDQEFPDDEYDPYESDPGESYRDHCKRLDETKTRSCLAIPKFLSKSKDSPGTVATHPPSPFSDDDDNNGQYEMPASLPRDLARVRYSLRTSIGDGSNSQQSSNMEERELRPNNVHINVSHWSDFGGRNYMEDRYGF